MHSANRHQRKQLLEHVAEKVEGEMRLKPTCRCFGDCFARNWQLKFMRRKPSKNVGTHALVGIDGYAYSHGPVPLDARPCEFEELNPRAQEYATIGHVVISKRPE